MFNYDEFINFHTYYDSIEREQQLHQQHQQLEYLKQLQVGVRPISHTNSPIQNQQYTGTQKKSTSLKSSIRNKLSLLSATTSANQRSSPNLYTNGNDLASSNQSNQSKSSAADYTITQECESTESTASDFVCQRQQVKQQSGNDLMRHDQAMNRFYISEHINSYDEFNRPKRLLKNQQARSASSKQASAYDSNESPVSTVSNSKSISSSSSFQNANGNSESGEYVGATEADVCDPNWMVSGFF